MKKKEHKVKKYYYQFEMRKDSRRMFKKGWSAVDIQIRQDRMGCALIFFFLPKKDVYYVTYERFK
jgi:hypothetical protein